MDAVRQRRVVVADLCVHERRPEPFHPPVLVVHVADQVQPWPNLLHAFHQIGIFGAKTADVCRKRGVSPATFYKRKAKFGGMEVSDVAKMRTLEDENRRLKRLLADSALEIDALKLIASGKF